MGFLNLYNIMESILNESVSPNDIVSAIEGKYKVFVNYDDEQYHKTGLRIIEPYVYGVNKSGNTVIRVFQPSGDTVRGVPHWKTMRLDRIISWKPTQDHFNTPPNKRGWSVEDYNNNGDGSMTEIFTQAKFDETSNGFEPNDRLQQLRAKTQQLKASTPMNINAIKQGQKGPIQNNVTNSIEQQNNQNKEFQDMLKRNLSITQKEKARRGRDMGGNKIVKSQPSQNDVQQQNQASQQEPQSQQFGKNGKPLVKSQPNVRNNGNKQELQNDNDREIQV